MSNRSFKKNVIASYVSQFYITGIGIVMLPFYINFLGAEAYGLVGFFTMLQSWFVVLDMGLTPTISRQMARYSGGSMTALELRQLFRALAIIFFCIATIGGGGLFIFSAKVVDDWINVKELTRDEVIFAIEVMAISVALRWSSGLYRGVVTGAEKIVWLSSVNSVIATLKFVGVFLPMTLFGATPKVFFSYQLAVAFIELIVFQFQAYRTLPKVNVAIRWSLKPLKKVLGFSLTIAFTSSVWIVATQTDKLVLSGILPLDEYGYFTLSVLVASSIMVLSGPVSNTLMPRLSRLNAENKISEFYNLYKTSTQAISVIAGAVAITIALCAHPLLYAWTGSEELADKASPILTLYAVGNGFLVMSAFSYYLQYSLGNLRYHLIGNLALVIFLIPTIILVAKQYGGVGAGFVWVALNAIFFIFWVAFVHKKLAQGLHFDWLVNDVLKILVPTIILVTSITMIEFSYESRLSAFIYVLIIGFVSLASNLAFSKRSRKYISVLFNK